MAKLKKILVSDPTTTTATAGDTGVAMIEATADDNVGKVKELVAETVPENIGNAITAEPVAVPATTKKLFASLNEAWSYFIEEKDPGAAILAGVQDGQIGFIHGDVETDCENAVVLAYYRQEAGHIVWLVLSPKTAEVTVRVLSKAGIPYQIGNPREALSAYPHIMNRTLAAEKSARAAEVAREARFAEFMRTDWTASENWHAQSLFEELELADLANLCLGEKPKAETVEKAVQIFASFAEKYSAKIHRDNLLDEPFGIVREAMGSLVDAQKAESAFPSIPEILVVMARHGRDYSFVVLNRGDVELFKKACTMQAKCEIHFIITSPSLALCQQKFYWGKLAEHRAQREKEAEMALNLPGYSSKIGGATLGEVCTGKADRHAKKFQERTRSVRQGRNGWSQNYDV